MKNYFRILLLISVSLMCFACAPSELYKIGQDMMAQNRPDEAVGYFEQALKEDPANEEYKAALAKAKMEAAIIFHRRAKEKFESIADPTMADLETIAKHSDKALSYDPRNPEIVALNKKIQDKIKSTQEFLKTTYAQAMQDISKEDWLAAITKLRRINQVFPNYEDTSTQLSKAEQEGCKQLYKQGLQMASQEEWRLAAQSFKAILDINPNYMDAAKLYEDAKNKDNVDYYRNAAKTATQKKQWSRAVTLMEKALEYQPENGELASELDKIKEEAGKTCLEESVQLAKTGPLSEAVKQMELAKSYVPVITHDPLYKSTAKLIVDKLKERANKYIDREMWGNALVWLQKAELLNPGDPDLFQKIIDVKDRINKRIRRSIAVVDFGSPATNKDAGRIVADKLISFLHKNASGDIRIIERESLQSILRELQLGQTGIVDIKSAQAVGKMRGIDTFIMGNVLHYSSKMTDTPSTSVAKVLVDEEDVANPDFSLWLMQHPKPTEEEWKLAPPKTIKKRNYQFISYRQGVAKVNAIIEVSYKLVDTFTGENIFTNTISGRVVKEDKYQDAVPVANIPHDPLELPTETEVLDDLTNEKIKEIGQSVLKHFQSLETVYFNEAQLLQKRRDFESAIEKYIDAVYDEKLKGINTPISKKSQEAIDEIIKSSLRI
ncbi:MAG: tetratricopeptide repeat protein [Syntrophales bacterium]|nr:tetratricopeptide repeat protein [Syntrophales bacterium]